MTTASPAYQKILVLLDGSDAAEFAIPFAADLARRHHADLLLLHLEALTVPVGDTGKLKLEKLDDQARDKLRAYLENLRNQLRSSGVRVQERIIESRNPPEALYAIVESERVSIIVMSTQGRVGMVRWALGDDIEKALKTIPVPVLLVRPEYDKIVVPLDGSKWSESAIPRAVELARIFDAALILLHVYQSPVSDYTDQLALAGQQRIADQTFEHMVDQLVSLRNRLRLEGLRAQEHLIKSNNPAQAICDFVETEEGTVMIVMSTHGRTGLLRWLAGSVAQKVLRNTRVPVTLVRPDAT